MSNLNTDENKPINNYVNTKVSNKSEQCCRFSRAQLIPIELYLGRYYNMNLFDAVYLVLSSFSTVYQCRLFRSILANSVG